MPKRDYETNDNTYNKKITDLKTAVLFFSATGNSKRIAEKVLDSFFKIATTKADLIDIAPFLKAKKTDKNGERNNHIKKVYNLIFIVLPVYSQMCHSSFIGFLKSLRFSGVVVPCVCCGGVSAGRSLSQIYNVFRKNGATVLAAAEFNTFHSYEPFNNYKTDKNYNSDKVLACESITANELCKKAALRFSQKEFLQKLKPSHFNFLSMILPKLRAQMGVKLKILDNNKCIGCKKCNEACLFGAIGKNQKPNLKCNRCASCVAFCNNRQLKLSRIMRGYLTKHIDYNRKNTIY